MLRVLKIEVNAIKHRSLLYDQVRQFCEQLSKVIHLFYNVVNLLLLYLLFSCIHLYFFLYLVLEPIFNYTLFIELAYWQVEFTLHAIQFADFVDMIPFNLSQLFGRVLKSYQVCLADVLADFLLAISIFIIDVNRAKHL